MNFLWELAPKIFPHFIFVVQLFCIIVKISIFTFLFLKGFRLSKVPQPLLYLIAILATGTIVDFSWILKMFRENYFEDFNYNIVLFFIRISWACNLALFQFFGLFIESLAEKNYKIRSHQIFLSIINGLFIFYFLIISLYNFHVPSPETLAENVSIWDFRPWHEPKILIISSSILFNILVLPSLFTVYRKLKSWQLPKILSQQLTILIKYLITPYIVTQFIESFFISSKIQAYVINSISTPLLTFALFYSTRKLMGIRFLNFQSHVQSEHKFNFIDDFKSLLEQLSHVTTTKELGHITQMFFKQAFIIMPSRIYLYCRPLSTGLEEDVNEPTLVESTVENFISRHSREHSKIQEAMRQRKIFIYDEIAFSNFYESDELNQELLHFLDCIDADVFIPIYDQQTLIAYIIVEREARLNNFYSNIERDEMLVFASYLGNIINLLQNRNLNRLIEREKEMREELYHKHQEINQYKESIRSFMRDSQQRKIGILFYKNRRFIFGNKDAKELINININVLEGHPLTQALKKLAYQVEEYKSGQTVFAKDSQGNKLVLAGIPNLEQNNVIITVCYPEISDIIKRQIEHLTNPTEWDYLLYLETTRSGQLINQLMPSSGERFLNFKIELLKIALSKKALLLEMPEEDLIPTVEILHHISLREQLHVLKLQGPISDSNIAVKLFGINPIFGKNEVEPLLEKLNNVGTIFIQNIHFLDIESQSSLANFIKYGYYHVYKSDQRISSNVRIICSTNQNLQTLIQEGRFSKQLFNELKQTTLCMPSLVTLPEQEFNELVEGFTEQAVASPAFKNLLELSEKDKSKLLNSRPVSLQEFKEKIQQLLVHKSKKSNIYQETEFDPAYNISDPELIEAARLGKKSLRDPKIMSMLWNKFKNQNKIAAFLGVNRSSVNRRCKEYNLC